MNTSAPTIEIARNLIAEQFPEYVTLPITDVEKQGHDNRTYRLGDYMLIRMPSSAEYAEKVAIEQGILKNLAPHLSFTIPSPIKIGKPSSIYLHPFSIYKWIPGQSLNFITLTDREKEQLALDATKFLIELQSISTLNVVKPGQHNWWRGDHVSVYDEGAREQISDLSALIDESKALRLWERACSTKLNKKPVWIHGDFAIGNILMNNGKLAAIIDFGSSATGDPACDLVIAWTYFDGRSRESFIDNMGLDQDTWLRARAWALWKATFELCQLEDKNSTEAQAHFKIIDAVLA